MGFSGSWVVCRSGVSLADVEVVTGLSDSLMDEWLLDGSGWRCGVFDDGNEIVADRDCGPRLCRLTGGPVMLGGVFDSDAIDLSLYVLDGSVFRVCVGRDAMASICAGEGWDFESYLGCEAAVEVLVSFAAGQGLVADRGVVGQLLGSGIDVDQWALLDLMEALGFHPQTAEPTIPIPAGGAVPVVSGAQGVQDVPASPVPSMVEVPGAFDQFLAQVVARWLVPVGFVQHGHDFVRIHPNQDRETVTFTVTDPGDGRCWKVQVQACAQSMLMYLVSGLDTGPYEFPYTGWRHTCAPWGSRPQPCHGPWCWDFHPNNPNALATDLQPIIEHNTIPWLNWLSDYRNYNGAFETTFLFFLPQDDFFRTSKEWRVVQNSAQAILAWSMNPGLLHG